MRRRRFCAAPLAPARHRQRDRSSDARFGSGYRRGAWAVPRPSVVGLAALREARPKGRFFSSKKCRLIFVLLGTFQAPELAFQRAQNLELNVPDELPTKWPNPRRLSGRISPVEPYTNTPAAAVRTDVITEQPMRSAADTAGIGANDGRLNQIQIKLIT